MLNQSGNGGIGKFNSQFFCIKGMDVADLHLTFVAVAESELEAGFL